MVCHLFGAPFAASAAESLSTTLELPKTRPAPLKWGRDPFVPLVKGSASADLALSAIIYSKDNPSAIINGLILYRGSTVKGQKIIDIGPTHVILHGEGGRTRLEITSVQERGNAD